jgi:alanine racemase
MTATLEIDLGAIAANWRWLNATHPGATAGVVKADAYGLGAALVAPALLAAGCRHFFVAHLTEALAIRHLLPGAMLAVLHGISPGQAGEFSAHGITPVLGSLPEIAAWRAEAQRLNRPLPALLHADTGMSRLGLAAPDLAALHEDPTLLSGLRLEFLMTHLVSAEIPDDPVNQAQAARFHAIRAGFPGVPASLANSSGMFLGETFHADLARPGAALYGINPTPGRPRPGPQAPVVRLSAPVLQIQHLRPGESVGYNGIWTAARPSRIAVVAVGYADGYQRALGNRATARFDGAQLPLVGRVSMDLTTFDVTDCPAIAPGDALELIGDSHDADALALEAGTNGYEILTSLGRRYRRAYLGAVPRA